MVRAECSTDLGEACFLDIFPTDCQVSFRVYDRFLADYEYWPAACCTPPREYEQRAKGYKEQNTYPYAGVRHDTLNSDGGKDAEYTSGQ